ncbi:hypothetical protein HYFRA_00012181 [Hymenoscyphus fraxineus]|uniref:Uncharacterized protein n=1 Tax=Hymenoscyphus fraxineus TaxID=746836 RepID=A0A9N9L325_9HELO|nr:hypothetical protein HYFRA_00012181 [Hymenoscyphus fraxineus]
MQMLLLLLTRLKDDSKTWVKTRTSRVGHQEMYVVELEETRFEVVPLTPHTRPRYHSHPTVLIKKAYEKLSTSQ